MNDLRFARDCLAQIEELKGGPPLIREALWRSAVVHYLKCFGDAGVRSALDEGHILKGEPPEAREAHSYFKTLRNKHLVHDENSYAQAVPGAAINHGDKPYKVEKVVCLNAQAVTLEQGNFVNLVLLTNHAFSWAEKQFDQVCKIITKELEALSYEELDAMDDAKYVPPAPDDFGKSRSAP